MEFKELGGGEDGARVGEAPASWNWIPSAIPLTPLGHHRCRRVPEKEAIRYYLRWP